LYISFLSKCCILTAGAGQKKLDKVICPDVWKDGANNTIESGGRKKNENKLLGRNRRKMEPYGKKGSMYTTKCKLCNEGMKTTGHYCQKCAYKKGICAMCGKKILDTAMYSQSTY